MFSGTESETKEFMAVCVETMGKYPLTDMRSPVFIFERLCSIIFPVRTYENIFIPEIIIFFFFFFFFNNFLDYFLALIC